MKTGTKVKTELSLDSKRVLELKGIVKGERQLFGREELKIEVTEVEPLWITKKKVHKCK